MRIGLVNRPVLQMSNEIVVRGAYRVPNRKRKTKSGLWQCVQHVDEYGFSAAGSLFGTPGEL
jgi:hypothetical protein